MTYQIRQEPEQLAFGIPSDWNTRPRLTLWMAFLVGFVATMVVVGGCFMMAEGLILNGLLVIVLGLIAASPLVWRRLPHHDVRLRRPDAQADLGIAFDQPRWRGAAAAEFYRVTRSNASGRAWRASCALDASPPLIAIRGHGAESLLDLRRTDASASGRIGM